MLWRAGVTKAAVLLFVVAVLAACTSTARFGGEPETTAAPPAPVASAETPPEPPPPTPPPVDLSGKWRLSAAGGACVMTLGTTPNTANTGTIAPAGGCPGSFFTSRKWSFDDNTLNIRDHKGTVLVQLSFADGSFSGKDAGGSAITLARSK